MNAPIIVFAFNRPDALKACIEGLQRNSEAAYSDLFVFVDGPRADREGESAKVASVREYASSITGFHMVETHFSDVNRKLGPSIIAGVTDVINRYGRAIIIEDDLIATSNLLSFLNQGLDRYESNREVFSICGYTNKVRVPKDYTYDAFFCSRSSSWGWATWKDRWNSCEWEFADWEAVEPDHKAFNRWGGSDCFGMLKDWKEGRNQSWAIRFCYNQFKQNAVSLFPVLSLIDNEGFDGSGTNCKKFNRYKFELDRSERKEFRMPETVIKDKRLYKESLRYYSIPIRIYSRLMNMYYDLKG